MATIHIDGKAYEVDGADNLLQACLSLGLDIPYFCWHPALGSVGACRQCAVKQFNDENDQRGRLVMACMTPAGSAPWISIEDEEARQFRESVVEWLMTNHPHDCPVCEEGGHCHLQDMTVMTGHSQRRYRFSKRTHLNQDLGPCIGHEMNRCIACYRCVRYYKDYAGGSDLGVYGAHANLYFGRVEDGTLESEFSGNLTEVCPTGVFTDKTHSARYNRKWDMQFAPSICHGCSLGCNISPGERYGEIRRIENRYHGAINHYFLCDRGRFGYGHVNRADRPRRPQLADGTQLDLDAGLDRAAALLAGKRVIGIGSPRASLESNFALRQLVGADHFYSGIAAGELHCLHLAVQLLQHGPLPSASLREMEGCDAALVLGEDLTQSAARMALALRQMVKGKAVQLAASLQVQPWLDAAVKTIGQQERYPLHSATPDATRLDDVALPWHGAPADIARLGFAVAHALDAEAPAVPELDEATRRHAERIAADLLAAERPLLIAGTSLGQPALLQAAASIAKALHEHGKHARIGLVLGEANSLGLALLGGDSADAALHALIDGKAEAAVVLENDLYRRANHAVVEAALQAVDSLLVLDHQHGATAACADLLLPAASFAEGDGTLVNQEGRAQRFFQVFEPSYYDADCLIREGWRWLHALHCTRDGRAVDWTQLDQVTAACAQAIPALAGIVEAAPSAAFRIKGLKLAREPHRYSGRTAMRANQSVHEPRAPQDIDSAFAFSMEGYAGSAEPRQQVAFAWAPGWNSPQAWNKFQDEVGGHLRAGDPGVRLLEPSGARLDWCHDIPPAFVAEPGCWRLVARQQLFGSEETSALAAPIQARMAPPCATLARADGQRLGLSEGARVRLQIAGESFELPLQLSDRLAPGLLALPHGIAGLPAVFDGLLAERIEEVRP
jgi:NADH-quinone oxidoreductase subunit G